MIDATRGLPTNIDAERFVLGSILLDDSNYLRVAAVVEADDLSLEKHRRIYRRMGDIQARGERIDRVTIAEELMRYNELEACDGLSYLVELDTGIPDSPNLDSYIRIVKDKATLRSIIFASQNTMNRALLGEESPEDIVTANEETFLRFRDTAAHRGLMTPAQIVERYEGGPNAFLDPARRPKGLSTGFTKLDEMTGGLHAGELFILAARPSMGKTALCLNIAQHVALKLKQTVAIFSLEMSRESLLTRMLCAASRVDSYRFRMGYLSQDERRKLAHGLHELTTAPLYIDDSGATNIFDLHAKLRRLQAERGRFGLVIVDYLQLLGSRGRVENRNQEVAAQSRGLKLMAKDLGCPVMALSQLSRKCDDRPDKRPQMGDLRDSGGIEADADVIAFIYRGEVYQKDREDLRGLAELIVGKQREGPIGTVNLVYLHSQTKFENRAEDTGEIDE